jgi:hypothetical protein
VEMTKTHQLLFYATDVNIVGERINTIRKDRSSVGGQ